MQQQQQRSKSSVKNILILGIVIFLLWYFQPIIVSKLDGINRPNTDGLQNSIVAPQPTAVIVVSDPILKLIPQPQPTAVVIDMSSIPVPVDTVVIQPEASVNNTEQPALSGEAYVLAAIHALDPYFDPSRLDNVTLANGSVVSAHVAQFFADCAYAQSKNLHTNQGCPSNSASLLGSGR